MALGSHQGIVDLCQSTNTMLVDRQLIVAQGLVSEELTKNGLTTPSTSTTLSLAVNNLACYLISTAPGEVDPRSNFKVAGFERSDGKGSQPQNYLDDYKLWFGEYLIAQGVKHAVPLGISVVGPTGRRIGEYEEQA